MVAMSIPQLFPAGHFYSPVVDPAATGDYLNRLGSGQLNTCKGIDLREPQQLELLHQLSPLVSQWRDGARNIVGGPRYISDNDQYGPGDAACFAGMIGHFRPKKIIEIGSGWSSALALDAAEVLDIPVSHTFIEPYPERLYGALRHTDRARVQVHERRVETLGLTEFEQLERNDILFIDSTHVYKPGSDVQYLLNEVLPVLADGVLIHIHDMFFPFEYPQAWIREGRNWNELYVVRMMLQFSQRYVVQFWNHHLASTQVEVATSAIPELGINPGGGLWLMVAGR
jgi:predicted O-methyltransferase YrrM